MPEKFIIQGGRPLKGEIEARGAKNAAFPILAAALLTKKECVVRNLPLVEDVLRMIEILQSMGVEISWIGERSVKVRAADLDVSKINKKLLARFRGSVLLYGPLLTRLGKFKLPPPGGCLIGSRPIDTHLDAFKQLGAEIGLNGEMYTIVLQKKPRNSTCLLNEFSVTATENVMLFSSLCPDKITLKIADQDYQVQELGRVLKKMGVGIKGLGTHTMEIHGRKQLEGFSHTILYDPLEAGTFIASALAARGNVLIKHAEISYLELFLKRLKDSGANFEVLAKDKIRVLPWKKLKIDRIQSLPYPGIHSDLQPELGVLATQAEGPTLIHDPLYEGRLRYLDELNRMGARIVFCDYHRALIYGRTPLYGIDVVGTDIRAGAAMLTAGLIAKGRTVLNNIYQVDRGYERIEERLQGIGADIKRVKS